MRTDKGGRMWTRRFSLALVALLLVGTACSSGKSSSSQNSVTIGAILGLTGPALTLGQSVETGLIAAINEINANGGADGVHINVKVTDNQVQPGPSVSQVQQQINVNHAIAIVSMYTTSTLALLPFAT